MEQTDVYAIIKDVLQNADCAKGFEWKKRLGGGQCGIVISMIRDGKEYAVKVMKVEHESNFKKEVDVGREILVPLSMQAV